MLGLLFALGSNKFILDCESIEEIIPYVYLNKITNIPHYVEGVLNYSGVPIPVIDIAHILENRASQRLMHSRIVIIKSAVYGFEYVGLICEKATSIVEIDKNLFKIPIIKSSNFSFLEGIYTTDIDAVQFFNVDELLKIFKEEMKDSLQDISSANI